MLLAGDIGGTKTVLALFAPQANEVLPYEEATFWNRDYPSLEAVIADFLVGVTAPISSACFGVAGPVVQGCAAITNLPWVISASDIQARFGFPQVFLLNDLEAIANAIPHLTADDLVTLNAGLPEPHGAIAVIAPGTGLGEAFFGVGRPFLPGAPLRRRPRLFWPYQSGPNRTADLYAGTV
jgi:glucokinase